MTHRIDESRRRRWVLSMVWRDLLFAHWPVPPEALAPHLPDGLELDLFDGQAWLGVVPFRMAGVRPRCVPALPRLSAFPELNLRTYVVADGRSGVWFYSLDAAEPWAVRAARWSWGLPYLHARMSCDSAEDGWIQYRSERRDDRGPPGRLIARYRPVGEPFAAEPGSLEHWLTERYCLYALDRRGRLSRGDVDHVPWPLQRAEWHSEACDMTRIAGVELPEREPHLLFAQRLSVRAWLPVRV